MVKNKIVYAFVVVSIFSFALNIFSETIRLSPSSLNLFLECPRCFWLEINKKTKRPETPMSSLPLGMHKLIKEYFDKYRLKGQLPLELKGKVEGKLMTDYVTLENWRDWHAGLVYKDKETGAVLMGAIDDCLLKEDFYIILDYKTRGFPIKNGSSKYYKNQLSLYTLLLKENKYKVKDYAYLAWYYPDVIKESGIIKFNIQIIKVKVDIDAAKKTFLDAAGLLKEEIPAKNPECVFCNWIDNAK